MTTTVINEILTYFRGNGYDASDKAQEKSYNKQVIVTLEGIDVEVETQSSYFITVTVNVKYQSDSPDDIISKFKTFPFEIEALLRDNTDLTDILVIEISTPTIELTGRLYELNMPIMYKEQILI